MDERKLEEVLKKHKLWLNDEPGGERADLRDTDLVCADLRDADLTHADLRRTDLRSADLRDADLRNVDLIGADLRHTDLRNTDLRDADIDYSAWPLWCGSKRAKVGRTIYLQLLAHLCAVDVDDPECKAHQQESLELAKNSRIAKYLDL